MAEGLPPAEVGKEIAEHRERSHVGNDHTGRDRLITIVEAALLAMVALLAAWSGYASAKWSTESRLLLAEASAARVEANRATALDAETLNFDSSTFTAWFTAYVADNEAAADVAMRRFRPDFRVAFDAWIASDPFNDDAAPPGPTYMPEYQRPQLARAESLDATANTWAAKGAVAADTADRYVRITVFLATVLFLVGISGHFRVRAARYGLVAVGGVILFLAVVLLVISPKPPL
jgi:hypothetical protein